VLHIALEIPLPAFDFGRLFERHDPRAAWVEVFHEALDGAALARGVASFEQDHDALLVLLDPGLQLEQFHLQQVLLRLVGLAGQQVPVGVGATAPVGRQHFVRVAVVLAAAFDRLCGLLEQAADRLGIVGRGAFQDGTQTLCLAAFAGRDVGQDVLDRCGLGLLPGRHHRTGRDLGDAFGPGAARDIAQGHTPGRRDLGSHGRASARFAGGAAGGFARRFIGSGTGAGRSFGHGRIMGWSQISSMNRRCRCCLTFVKQHRAGVSRAS